MTTQLELNAWNLVVRVHPAAVVVAGFLALALAAALMSRPDVLADPVMRSAI